MILVMGVAGSGKTTVGRALAEALDVRFCDADDLHPAANVAKMRRGEPLDDADRAPWLEALVRELDGWSRADAPAPARGVLACSALRRAFRARLLGGRAGARLVHLEVEPAEAARRMAARRNHYMPASLMRSQFEALEPPTAEERPLVVRAAPSPAAAVEAVLAALGEERLSQGSAR